MLRRMLLYLSTAGWMRGMMSHFFVARRMALRFVAGETLGNAIETAKTLKERGILATMDYLGESIEKAEDTEPVTKMYCQMMEAIHQNRLEASVSLKLTHLGLNIGEELCVTNLRTILTQAKSYGVPVTIDMENTPYTDITLRLYHMMRDEYGFDNVGTVIQSYLYRSEEDMRQLAAENAHIRLCKGAYLESAEVAFPEKADVDANYVKLTEQYLRAGTDAYLCIATHDEKMIEAAEEIIHRYNIPPDRYEFQMLYGIRAARQMILAADHKMRVYVPFGEAWYPYFMRRLAERPANLWFFTRALFRA